MKSILTKALVPTGFLLMPMFAFAQTFNTGSRGNNDLFDILYTVGDILQLITMIVGALALLYFFWGLSMFIFYANQEEKRKEGRQVILWGLIALFIIFSIWGLIQVMQNTFLNDTTVRLENFF